MITSPASTTVAAINAPTTTLNGLRRSSSRSLNVPGSPTAALTTAGVAPAPVAASATVRHLIAVGNPAPPRPRRPLASSSSIVPSAPNAFAAASPRPPPAAM
jgi:hypothetical protein